MRILLKRAYEAASGGDGPRILVERLWPRGVSKARAAIDHWVKDLAPSTELRKWFDHDPEKWPEFRRRYFEELEGAGSAVDDLRGLIEGKTVTFVFASREERFNNAVALKEFLERRD